VTSYTFGGVIHILVVLALITVIIRLFQGGPYGWRGHST
jgi:hypothetical protein